MRRSAFATGLALAWLLAAPALQAEGSRDARPDVRKPTAGAETPMPAPVRPRPRMHGYFMFGMGLGHFAAAAGASEDERTFSGRSIPWQLLIGGQFANGFTLGGAYVRDDMSALSAEDEVLDGDEPPLGGVTMTLGALCIFGDYRPFAQYGFHVQGGVGLGTFSVSGEGLADDGSDGIVAWFLGTGYDVPVAGNFQVGGLFRLTLASFRSESGRNPADVTVAIPSLLLTLGFH